jgi:dolichol-phosphate mannosyltransferase
VYLLSSDDDNSRHDLEIIIPVRNEKGSIEYVIEEILREGFSKDQILVVDGRSTDGSREIAEKMGVRVVVQDGYGKADAIKTAVRKTDAEYMIFLDGDYTYPAKYINDIISKLDEGYDLVIGWRKILEPGSMSLIYKIGNKIITFIFNIMFGTKLSDVLSGMYGVRRSLLQEMLFETKGFSIESEIVAHVISTGGEVTEIPIEYRRRKNPKAKKLKIIDGVRIFRDIILLTWRYNPTFLLFFAGALMLIPGLILGAYVAYHHFFVGITYFVKGLIAIMLTLAGFQSLLLAILSLYLKRSEIRSMRLIRRIMRDRKKSLF